MYMTDKIQIILEQLATPEAFIDYFDGEGYGHGRCTFCTVSFGPDDSGELVELIETRPEVHDENCPWRLAHELQGSKE